MNLETIRRRFERDAIFFAEATMQGRPAVIGYDKTFRWRWFATQLNTFVVAIDYGTGRAEVPSLDAALEEAFAYAMRHHTGWPRGLQSGVAAIALMLSVDPDSAAIARCRELGPDRRWAGFALPVLVDKTTGRVHAFERTPTWGMLYFPHFRKLIDQATS